MLFCFCQITNGQEQSIDSSISLKYIEPIKDLVTIKLVQHTEQETLGVITPTSKVTLRPNSLSVSKLSFNYRFISFSLSHIMKFLPGNDDDNIKGKTRGSGFGFNFNFKHWQQELSYEKTKGYYLDNTSDFISGWKEGDPYTQFKDLTYLNFQGVTAYNFNSNFSVNAVATQSERQIRSAGSFIPHLLYRYYIIDDRTKLTGTNSSQKAGNWEVVLGAGYYHNFVFKKNWYFSMGVTPGVGYIFTDLTTRYPSETILTKQKNAVFRIDGRTGLGYNGKRFFSGIHLKFSGSAYQQQRTKVTNQDQTVSWQLFAGYRFSTPKWLKYGVDRLVGVVW